jgi:hypothetical protein
MDGYSTSTRPPEVSDARAARFTRRISTFEDPRVVDRLERAAADSGLSVSAAIRSAIRYWLGPEDEDE